MPKLSPVAEKFILHWGEMGTRWGINRTVAQIHALLYLSPQPLHAEEIAQTLSVARSNVSTSLRELQGWGIVRVAHVLGDRRDHFESMKDVCDMFRLVLEERKRREVDPTLAMLRSSVSEAEAGGKTDAYTKERLAEMLEFFENVTGLYQQLEKVPPNTVKGLLKGKGRLRKLVDMILSM
jgi:DNA-binding transcriptional regulator GbsR (MarR family)